MGNGESTTATTQDTLSDIATALRRGGMPIPVTPRLIPVEIGLAVIPPGIVVPDVWEIILNDIRGLVSSLSISFSAGEEGGYFILVLLFSAWQEYIRKVKRALENEVQHLPEKEFIPGGNINRPDWEKIRLKIYVFSQYGNYIDQKHMSVHEGLTMVYLDQSGKSKRLVLHRFDLSADDPGEGNNQKDENRIRGTGRVPAHEYVEEFYYRTLMRTGSRDGMPEKLIKILERTQPGEIVARMLNFAASHPDVNLHDMTNAFLQFDINKGDMFQIHSSSSSGSGSTSNLLASRDNMLTEMLHIRDNMLFKGIQGAPAYEGTLENVSLLELWKVVRQSMRDFPKTYSLLTANCQQFCTKILDSLKSNVDMKKNMDDSVLQEILKPIDDYFSWIVVAV